MPFQYSYGPIRFVPVALNFFKSNSFKCNVSLRNLDYVGAEVLTAVVYLLGYNTVQSVAGQPKFRRNISPPSSRSKNKPSKIPATRRYVQEDSTLQHLDCFYGVQVRVVRGKASSVARIGFVKNCL
jgi:hypothetical protein